MEKVVFQNPVFREGLMQTIRRGDKRKKFDKGYMEAVDGRGNTQGTIDILTSELWRFIDIPYEVIGMSHDPDCQMYDQIVDAMTYFYQDFETSDLVTVVWFYLR